MVCNPAGVEPEDLTQYVSIPLTGRMVCNLKLGPINEHFDVSIPLTGRMVCNIFIKKIDINNDGSQSP